MVPIAGIGDVPEPLGARPVRDRAQRTPAKATTGTDEVTFSAKALVVSQAARSADDTPQASAVRSDRVEAAKQRIREGSYQVQNVVEQVAARLTPYL